MWNRSQKLKHYDARTNGWLKSKSERISKANCVRIRMQSGHWIQSVTAGSRMSKVYPLWKKYRKMKNVPMRGEMDEWEGDSKHRLGFEKANRWHFSSNRSKESVESWFETRLKVDHQVRARIMANLGENEILAQFLSIIFTICTLCIIYGQKSRCSDLLFGRRERETMAAKQFSM